MIQLLPSSYNQRRTVKLNYEVLNNMLNSGRDTHKLDEWREFCRIAKTLPYSKVFFGYEDKTAAKTWICDKCDTAYVLDEVEFHKGKYKYCPGCGAKIGNGAESEEEEIANKINDVGMVNAISPEELKQAIESFKKSQEEG
jgi:hypothetical protein